MVAPITGPFTSNIGTGSGVFMTRKTWYRQKKPYNLRLPFELERAAMLASSEPNPPPAYEMVFNHNALPRSVNEAKSKAWAQFTDNVTTRVGAGVDLVEFGQSIKMIANRTTQLFHFVKALKRGNFGDAYDSLELPRGSFKDRWSHSRSVASMFLEAHFGWQPIIEDIHAAAKVFAQDISPKKVYGKGSSAPVLVRAPALYPYSAGQDWTVSVRASYHADIMISNPNVALANAFGLLNPVALAVEVIPFSFVADWFTNMSQVLGSVTDLLGYDVSNATTTITSTTNYFEYWNGYPWSTTGIGFKMSRTSGLNRPGFYVKPFKGFGIVRGITAMALLVQQLPSDSKSRNTVVRPRPPLHVFDNKSKVL